MPALRRFSPLLLLLCLFLFSAPARAQADEPPFMLHYPTDARPAQITQKFVKPAPGKTAHEGIDLHAPNGAHVLAAAAGEVKKVVTAEDGKGWGAYIIIKTVHNGIKYKVTYANLRDISVSVGDSVTVGQRLARSAGATIKLVVQASEGGLSGFQVKNVVSPKPLLTLDGLRLRPTDNNLRLRAAPN
ncbi:MAG: M23 family metallopeptidase, partial [Armatimonadetes bacterium]|nr:M23 family metallopeptidase [Anaerolineae bacterium]